MHFHDAFAPVARMESVRVLTLVAQEGWQVHHMDVKSAFLNGDLKEEVYVRQPLGYTVAEEEGKVYCLRNSTACARHRTPGTRSSTPHSRRWASSRAHMRWRCIDGAANATFY